MDLERFEELLSAELEGELTPLERRELEAACADHAGLHRMRRQNLKLIEMVSTLGPHLAPESFLAETMSRVDSELLAVEHAEPEPEPEPVRAMPAIERRRYDERRSFATEPEKDPWWYAFFASPFFKWTSAMAVMAVLIYMGSVVLQRNGVQLPPVIPGGSRVVSQLPTERSDPQSIHEDRKIEVAVAAPQASPALGPPESAPMEREQIRVADAGKEAREEPPPPTDEEKTSAESSDPPDKEEEPPVEVAKAEPTPASTTRSVNVRATDITRTPMPPPERAIAEVATAPLTSNTPLPRSQGPSTPAVELPDATTGLQERMIASIPQTNPATQTAEAVAPASTESKGMEKVFNEIRTDLEGKDVPGGGTTAPGVRLPDKPTPPRPEERVVTERVVIDPQGLRTALAQQEPPKPAMPERQVAALPQTPPQVTAPQLPPVQPGQPQTRIVDSTSDLRKALDEARRTNQSPVPGTQPALPAIQPAPRVPAAISTPTQIGIQLADAQPAVPSTSPGELEQYQRSFATANRAPAASEHASIKEIERAVLRNGGHVIRRGPDAKNPSFTRLSCRMTGPQLAAFVKDLERMGIGRSGQSGPAWRESATPTPAPSSAFYVVERGQVPGITRTSPADVAASNADTNQEIELVVVNSR